MYLPDYVKKIITTLEENGYLAYLVGGCVRDYLMGITPDDYDVATNALPDKVATIFEKTYNTGAKHGTVTVLENGKTVEVTTFRSEGLYENNRKPSSVEFINCLDEDLKRRDFTMNAIAYNDKTSYIDLFSGMSDIRAGKIKCVGNPDERFKEDALRMLRAIRFSCKTGFNLTPSVKEGIRNNASLIKSISKERIKSELEKAITSPYRKNISLIYELGLSKYIASWLDVCMKTPQNTPYHIYSVGEHMLKTLEYANGSDAVMWASLLHDVGKPYKRVTDTNKTDHFKGHEEVSAQIADDIAKELKFSNELREKVVLLIKNHRFDYEISDYGIKKAIKSVGRENFDDLIALMTADSLAHSEDAKIKRLGKIEEIKAIYEQVKDEPIYVGELVINGEHLKKIGFSGVQIGKVLDILSDDVMKVSSLNTLQKLEERAREIMKEGI